MPVRSYKPTDSTLLTEHFRSSEFRCKCGGTHNTLISDDLVQKLERLRKSLNCSRIVVNSGYRCPSHDKAVGGTGGGQHTKGTAADIVCYDSGGAIISSKLVTCAAQDTGFSGIANIDEAYTATHVDTANRKWYGDETVTTSESITTDFYRHWSLEKSDVYEKSAVSEKVITLTIDGKTYTGVITEKHI